MWIAGMNETNVGNVPATRSSEKGSGGQGQMPKLEGPSYPRRHK